MHLLDPLSAFPGGNVCVGIARHAWHCVNAYTCVATANSIPLR